MTARHEAILQIAEDIAQSEGKSLGRLDAAHRLRLTGLAGKIMATTERKMRGQSHQLNTAISQDWNLPA